MKLGFKQLSLLRDENKGFTLLELILYFGISSVIVLALFSALDFTLKVYVKGQEEDKILLNGRHAIEYIKKEIKAADKIISIDYIERLNEKYENNIGFIIFNYEANNPEGYKYNYVTFYLKDDKIYRIAANSYNSSLPKYTAFEGHNIVAENVISIEGTEIDFNSKIVKLNIILKDLTGKEHLFKSTISIRCIVES